MLASSRYRRCVVRVEILIAYVQMMSKFCRQLHAETGVKEKFDFVSFEVNELR